MILVTAATGNIGRVLVDRLDTSGVKVRALTRNAGQSRLPVGVDISEGDLARPLTLRPAFAGVETLFLVLPGVGDPAAIVELAREAGVCRIVLVSSMLAETHPGSSLGRRTLAAEAPILAGGLPWTILRPGEFASNALSWRRQIAAGTTIRVPANLWSPVIHPADVAAVAHTVLTTDGHDGRTYALTGPESITPEHQMRALSRALGRRLAFEALASETALTEFAHRVPREILAGLAGGAPVETAAVQPTVEELTGSPGRTFQRWAYDHAGAFS